MVIEGPESRRGDTGLLSKQGAIERIVLLVVVVNIFSSITINN